VFKAQGWNTSPFNLYPAKGRNMWRDLERLCGDVNLPFRRPEPFPQNSLLASRVALVGLNTTWGEEFCRTVFLADGGSAFSARRVLSLRTVSYFGAMIVSNVPLLGQRMGAETAPTTSCSSAGGH
jgi:hypothetical protein